MTFLFVSQLEPFRDWLVMAYPSGLHCPLVPPLFETVAAMHKSSVAAFIVAGV